MSYFKTTWHENIILLVCNSVVVAYTQRPVAPEPGHLIFVEKNVSILAVKN